jgi:hypothetical protein
MQQPRATPWGKASLPRRSPNGARWKDVCSSAPRWGLRLGELGPSPRAFPWGCSKSPRWGSARAQGVALGSSKSPACGSASAQGVALRRALPWALPDRSIGPPEETAVQTETISKRGVFDNSENIFFRELTNLTRKEVYRWTDLLRSWRTGCPRMRSTICVVTSWHAARPGRQRQTLANRRRKR